MLRGHFRHSTFSLLHANHHSLSLSPHRSTFFNDLKQSNNKEQQNETHTLSPISLSKIHLLLPPRRGQRRRTDAQHLRSSSAPLLVLHVSSSLLFWLLTKRLNFQLAAQKIYVCGFLYNFIFVTKYCCLNNEGIEGS